MKSMIDEDLSISNDSDFDDLFPTPEDIKSSEFDELVTVVNSDESMDDDSHIVVEEHPKKRGRPAKTSGKKATEKKKDERNESPAVPKKRGRPAKKAVVEEDSPSEEVVVAEKKTRGKRVSVDDFPPEVLDRIFEEYSQRTITDLAKELEISEKYIHKAILRMKELFEMSISTGDLTQEDYDEFIAPKFEEYQEPKDEFETFVQNKIKHIKK